MTPDPFAAPPAVSRGDRLMEKDRRLYGTAMSGGESGTVTVKQDNGAIASWSVHDIEVLSTQPSPPPE